MFKNLITSIGVGEEALGRIKTAFADAVFEKYDDPEKLKARIREGNFRKYVILLMSNMQKTIHEFPNNKVIIGDRFGVDDAIKQINWIFANFGKDWPMTDNTFFISDNHFCHGNIIKYCERPWNSGKDADGNIIVTPDDIERMNDEMVFKWNSVVGKDDIVWNLGDFCLGSKENIQRIFPRLNGRINLVLGNHDRHSLKFYYSVGFNRVYDRPVVINDFFVLSHAPLQWVKNPMFNIFGHVHDSSIYKTWSADGCCVCVERHDYTPVSWKTIRENIEKIVNTEA